ncbi:MAG: NAD(P)-dependent oxidoreductase [Aeromicrobium sp.]|uniref:precorrin-2 dehydrogenase/sirohydrochlorin ferrochelatase family protein n=1 Tax=Aeromicrobium sp. TaxID=1871063 RepID=UPI0039E6F018
MRPAHLMQIGESLSMLPISLRVNGRRVLVVGGGTVATRRVRTFLAADAEVVVVAPEASATLIALAGEGALAWHARRYVESDLDDAWLVQTATASPVDDVVAADAEARRVWCLKGGDPAGATAWMPAVARVEGGTIAVSGEGSARRAVRLRDRIVDLLRQSPPE